MRIIVENRLPELRPSTGTAWRFPSARTACPGLVAGLHPARRGVRLRVRRSTSTARSSTTRTLRCRRPWAWSGSSSFIPRRRMNRSSTRTSRLVTQEFSILPNSDGSRQPGDGVQLPDIQRPIAPLTTPLVVKLGHRVRIRLVNFSTADHHPIHLHGHTWWVTGTEGGRIPEPGWMPGNNVLGRGRPGARRRVHRQQPRRLDHALPYVSPHDEPHGVDGRPDDASRRR